MTVAKVDYGYWHTLIGTIAEVAAALRTYGVQPQDVLSCTYDSGATAWTAIYYKGS